MFIGHSTSVRGNFKIVNWKIKCIYPEDNLWLKSTPIKMNDFPILLFFPGKPLSFEHRIFVLLSSPAFIYTAMQNLKNLNLYG